MPRRPDSDSPLVLRPCAQSLVYAITDVDGTLTTTYKVCLLYDPAKALTGGSIPIKLYLCDSAGKNLSASSITLTAHEVLRDATAVKTISPPGPFTFSATLKKGGGYQFNLSTKGLTTGQNITYRLKFRVSTDVPGIYQYAPFTLK